MASISLRSLFYFVVVVLFVGCTVLLMQGMLPGVGDNSMNGPAGVQRPTDPLLSAGGARAAPDVADRGEQAPPAGGRLPSTGVDVTKIDLLAENVPSNLEKLAKEVRVEGKRVSLMGHDMFYREATPPKDVASTKQNVLLLHGMAFKSQTWLDLGTIGSLAAMGHRVVAVDLPGYGETGGKHVETKSRGKFLDQVVSALKLDSAVIVSPSMSGSFSLPHLIAYPGVMGGFVPVAPVSTERFTKEQYESVKTPTLVVYGELDKQLGIGSAKHLKHIPNSQVHELPKAEHAAYLDQPQLFHQLMYNFLLVLMNKRE